jgi:NADP-reducing hydrogenase subunit HndB
MSKVKSLDDLRKMRDEVKLKLDLREKGENAEKAVQIRVSMATCGIASGAKEIMSYLIEEMEHRSIDGIVTQTGCMGYCYAEPTIEVTIPGKEPLVFGDVDTKKASEIIEKYIKKGEMVDGIIPVTYNTIDKDKTE